MIIADHNFLILSDNATFNTSDCNSAYIFVIVNGRYKHLQFALRVTLGSRNMLDNLFKQRNEILAGYIGRVALTF